MLQAIASNPDYLHETYEVFRSLNIGTHEVQSCVANNCSRPGTVNINCTFSENSKAKGYLSILCSETNSSQERFVVANRTSSSELKISVSGLPRGNYTVVVFDLESNGLPVLSDDSNPYVLAAEEEDITVTNPAEAGGMLLCLKTNTTIYAGRIIGMFY